MTLHESQRSVTLIAAFARDEQNRRVIGDHGRIPWHSREDFAHFKETTMGGTLIMGRLTWDSIGRPLPGRRTIVVTRNPEWAASGAEVVHSLEQALAVAAESEARVFIAGGAQLYAQSLRRATDQILTEVHQPAQGDAFYPEFDEGEWSLARTDQRPDLTPALTWTWWQRR